MTGRGQELVAGQLTALGVSRKRTAKVLGVALASVNTILARPHVQEYVQQVREATRHIAIANIEQAQEAVGEWLQETITTRDPRAFDAVTRGVLALEKTAASAAGENRPPSQQVAVVSIESQSAEAKDLIRALFHAPRHDG